ncbi:hypothetical protein FRB95_010466, partial [Tulasnella sp. JGI-2019a]
MRGGVDRNDELEMDMHNFAQLPAISRIHPPFIYEPIHHLTSTTSGWHCRGNYTNPARKTHIVTCQLTPRTSTIHNSNLEGSTHFRTTTRIATMASRELGRSAGTYIQGAAQISLDLLQSLGNLIPIPYVTTVVATVTQLIQIAQTVQNNVKGVDVLIEHLKRSYLEQSVARFKTDLVAIEKTVLRVKKQTDTSGLSIVKAFLRYGDNAGLIAEGTSRLEWAMQYFEVESRIQDSIRIAQMANEVHEVHEDIKNVKQGVNPILENLDAILRLPMPSAAIPPKPALFYGRDAEVEDIAHRIITTCPSRFGITGAGGIGKTSLVSAILEHTDVVQYFESRIHWARCDEASSVPLLIEIIAKAFRLDPPSKDRLQDIKLFLQFNTQPRLLVLDNFETPWDIGGRQSDITDILCVLAAFPHLAILVTMRGTLPGIGR